MRTTIPNSLFIRNRKNLATRLPKKSVAVFTANEVMPRNGDEFYPFRQQSDFFYLTGIDADNAYLLVYEQSEEEALVYSGISENYGQAVSLPIDGYTLNNPDSLAHELTFQPADNGEWYIKDGDAYLGYNGRSSTLVLSPEPASFGFTWQITQESILNGDYLLGRL